MAMYRRVMYFGTSSAPVLYRVATKNSRAVTTQILWPPFPATISVAISGVTSGGCAYNEAALGFPPRWYKATGSSNGTFTATLDSSRWNRYGEVYWNASVPGATLEEYLSAGCTNLYATYPLTVIVGSGLVYDEFTVRVGATSSLQVCDTLWSGCCAQFENRDNALTGYGPPSGQTDIVSCAVGYGGSVAIDFTP